MPKVVRSTEEIAPETTAPIEASPEGTVSSYSLDDFAQMLRKYRDPLEGLRTLGNLVAIDDVRVYPMDHLVQAEVDLSLQIAEGDWWKVEGIGVHPLVSPYQKCVEAAYENAVKFALTRLGLKVEYADEPEAKAPVATVSYSGVTPASQATAVAPRQPIQATVEDGVCTDCGNQIGPWEAKSGRPYTAQAQVERSLKEYQVPLCNVCQGKRWARSQPKTGGYRR